MEAISGYIVEGKQFQYLDGKMSGFRGHSENHTGFVHSADSLLNGGDWVPKATRVYLAQYDPRTRLSKTIGEGVPFSEFLASLSAA